MKRTRFIKLDVTGGLPTEFVLFKAGDNRSTKGTISYDPSKAAQLQARYDAEDGRDLIPIDVAHLSLESPLPEAHKAIGWFRVDFAEDAIWARDVEWTEYGAEKLRNREFRFISPAFYADETGEFTSLINCAVTNIPATIDALPLVADRRDSAPKKITMSDTEHNDEAATALAELSPEEMQAALEQATAENESLKAKVAELEAALAAAQGTAEQASEQLHRFQKEALVSKLTRDGHMQPSLKAWAMKQTLDSLKDYETDALKAPHALSKKVNEKSVTADLEHDPIPSLRVPPKKTSPQA